MNINLIAGILSLSFCINVNASTRGSEDENRGVNPSANAKIFTDIFGWLDSVTVSQNNILLGQAIGRKDRFLNINLNVVGLNSASNGPVNCVLLILEKTEPYVAVGAQNQLNSTPLKNIFETYNDYIKGQFVKLTNLQVVDYSNQTFCLASSIEPQNSNNKTTATFASAAGFAGTMYESADRWTAEDASYKFFYAPDASGSPGRKHLAVYSPINYGCVKFRWPTDAYAVSKKKEFDQYIQNNSIDKFANSGIKMEGVRPLNESGLCTFDSANLLAPNEKKQEKITTNNPDTDKKTDNSSDQYVRIERLTVVVTAYEKSNFEKCKEQAKPQYPLDLQCGPVSEGIFNTSPTLMFKLSDNEIKKYKNLGFMRVDGVRLQRAQWKEGFLPNNIEKLENAQGKQVTLINVDIQKKPVGIARYNYLIERAEFDD